MDKKNINDMLKVLTEEQKRNLGITDDELIKMSEENNVEEVEEVQNESHFEEKFDRDSFLAEMEAEDEEIEREMKAKKEKENKLQNNIEVVKEVPKEEKKEKPVEEKKKMKTKKEFLNSFKISDLGSVTILDDFSVDNFDAFNGMEFTINGKPTTETVCNQSCYIAEMEGLTYGDLVSLQNSTASLYSAKQRLYKTIYSKINTTSLGNLDYDTFLKVTSLFDMESLTYGVYCQTFEDETEFSVTCAHCGNTINVKFKNSQLIQATDDEVFGRIRETIETVHNPQEALKKSLLSKTERIILPDSKIIVDMKIPSLSDQLGLLSTLNESKAENIKPIINLVFFIRSMYVPDMGSFLNQKPAWVKVNNSREYIAKLANLSFKDQEILNDKMNEFVTKYRVDYAVPSFTCNSCNKPTGNIDVVMDQLLFMRMAK